jgi:hypothetical protein
LGKFTDPDTAKYMQSLWRWLNLAYQKIGADADVLPASLGGTGTSSVAQTVAVQGAATTSPSATALTQSRIGVTLTRPADAFLDDFADTTITWDAAFADATYNVTLSFHQVGVPGAVSLVSQTANQIVVRLTNTSDEAIAPTRGTVDATGVHA